MSPRKPPRLAICLLNSLGLGRQNPPLTGDLLEEFHNGRSAAWFWRQALVAIVTMLARSGRCFRQPLMSTIPGWATQAGVAFGLRRFHLPPQLHGSGAARVRALAELVAFLLVFIAAMLLRWRRFTAEVVESPGQLDEGTERVGQPFLMKTSACVSFWSCLIAYNLFALLCAVPFRGFIGIQVELLLASVAGGLVLASSSAPSSLLTARKQL